MRTADSKVKKEAPCASPRKFLTASRILAATFLLLSILPAIGKPNSRHTEEYDVPADRRGERILLLRQNDYQYTGQRHGVNRADALAHFILSNYGKPDYVFIASEMRRADRSKEALAPLAQMAGVEVNTTVSSGNYHGLASRLLKQPQYEGKLIVIAWPWYKNSNLPAFARALNAQPAKYNFTWNPRYSNQVLQLDYHNGSNDPEVMQFTEPF